MTLLFFEMLLSACSQHACFVVQGVGRCVQGLLAYQDDERPHGPRDTALTRHNQLDRCLCIRCRGWDSARSDMYVIMHRHAHRHAPGMRHGFLERTDEMVLAGTGTRTACIGSAVCSGRAEHGRRCRGLHIRRRARHAALRRGQTERPVVLWIVQDLYPGGWLVTCE